MKPPPTRSVLTCLLLLMALGRPALARPDALDELVRSGQLKFGADKAGGAPYVFQDPANPQKLTGFEAEIAEALAAELSRSLGRPVEAVHVQGDWEILPPLLEQGRMDLVLNGYELTPERKE